MPETSAAEKLKWADHPHIHSLSGLRFPKNEKWKDLFRGRSLEMFGIFFDDSTPDTQGEVELRLMGYVNVINQELGRLPKGPVFAERFASDVDQSLIEQSFYSFTAKQVYKSYPLGDRLKFVFGIINTLVLARNAFVQRMGTGPAPACGGLGQVVNLTRLLLLDCTYTLVDGSKYGFLGDEMDRKAPASEASSDDNILTPSTSQSVDVAETQEPVQEPIPARSIRPVVPESRQSLHPCLVQGSTHARFLASSTSAPTPVIKEDGTDSVAAKEDVLGKYKERCNVMSSRIERLEKENRQLQTRFVTKQTLKARTTLSLQDKQKELCRFKEAFSKIWQAHRRQLNSGLEANGMEGLSWGADDAGIYLDSLDLGTDS
ncbi:hypothetical protein GCG54_00015007 [Colletotrichum gloeosporioides]|uniref:Uncharacterized protein n=1 Tax=Colletotrichum gloeosporioides TaxID=474922 RepID=A0A8H4CDH8_COLGL|nr:uncharacterized protein GCG54_00015007 [Colletotrichum gloeosporioides]KAF3801788.1 hypothetical protein GCG54_00015007 [Colletotrichum gloeosporioides]